MDDDVEMLLSNVYGPNTSVWIDEDEDSNDRASDFCSCRNVFCYRNMECSNYSRNIECGLLCFNEKCLNSFTPYFGISRFYRSLFVGSFTFSLSSGLWV